MRPRFFLRLLFLFFTVLFATTTNAACTFTIDAGNDTIICGNQSAYLHGTVSPAGAYTYAWSPASSLTGSNTLTPTANPSITTKYYLSVTDGGGC
ncbi:MAG TPA: hypothetical protein VG603_07880, partial [Chitinophagales bacterium]|nr:hypothetical protein [Chitinophagales bacterium]